MGVPFAATRETREAFADTIRGWREGRGITRGEFAAMCGFSRQRLFDLESGRYHVTYESLMHLAQVLNTTAWNLCRCAEERLNNKLPGPGTRGPREQSPHGPDVGAPPAGGARLSSAKKAR